MSIVVSDMKIVGGKSPVCECDNTESRFVQDHGCCEYCHYGLDELDLQEDDIVVYK